MTTVGGVHRGYLRKYGRLLGEHSAHNPAQSQSLQFNILMSYFSTFSGHIGQFCIGYSLICVFQFVSAKQCVLQCCSILEVLDGQYHEVIKCLLVTSMESNICTHTSTKINLLKSIPVSFIDTILLIGFWHLAHNALLTKACNRYQIQKKPSWFYCPQVTVMPGLFSRSLTTQKIHLKSFSIEMNGNVISRKTTKML